MRSTSDAPARPDQGLFGVVPPGRPSDLAVVVLVGVAQVALTIGAARGQADREPLDLLAFLLLVAGPVALFWRRRSPVLALVAVMASNVLYFGLGYAYGPAWLALIVAFWTAVTAGARRVAWATAFVGLAAYYTLAALVDRNAPPTAAAIAAHLGWLLVILVGAEVAMAGRQRRLAAERTRAEEARRRAGEERMRIARELHDVLAHNISLINVQAGVALHLMDEQPGQSRSALQAIKQASNDALGELRSVLNVLRQGDEAEPRSPASGLAHLDSLVAGAGAAGVRVRTRVEGTPRPLPAGTDLAAFRIVQESLTNVTRHAGPATATVRVAYGPADLVLEITDDGKGVESAGGRRSTDSDRQNRRSAENGGESASGRRSTDPDRRDRRSGRPGQGLVGMRERVTALGGELTAGPRPGGGFRVLARLPLDHSDGETR